MNSETSKPKHKKTAVLGWTDYRLFLAMKADHGDDYVECQHCETPTHGRYICRKCKGDPSE